jgi:hypothetical protein
MSQASLSLSEPIASRPRRGPRPFFGVIDSVIVEDPAEFDFDGAIPREHAAKAWTWMVRDLAPDLIDPLVDDTDPATLAALDAQMPDLLGRARSAVAAVSTSRETERRLMTAVGGEEPWKKLPTVLNALKCRALLEKAQGFGRATNGMPDEAALAHALHSMPLSDRAVAALLMQAAVGQVANPSRLMTAVIRITGAPTEAALVRAGYGTFVEALLAHAQNQIPALVQVGPFADIDLACRAIERFHRLVRAINAYIELPRNGRWSRIVGALTKAVSERIEPRLRDVVGNLNMAMRRHAGHDRVDADQLLQALNGVYLLAAVRDARDSLALNAVFDQTWAQLGQALEIYIERNLELLRQNPGDRVIGARLDAVIKMVELRFNPEHADVLRRAKETAERR